MVIFDYLTLVRRTRLHLTIPTLLDSILQIYEYTWLCWALPPKTIVLPMKIIEHPK